MERQFVLPGSATRFSQRDSNRLILGYMSCWKKYNSDGCILKYSRQTNYYLKLYISTIDKNPSLSIHFLKKVLDNAFKIKPYLFFTTKQTKRMHSKLLSFFTWRQVFKYHHMPIYPLFNLLLILDNREKENYLNELLEESKEDYLKNYIHFLPVILNNMLVIVKIAIIRLLELSALVDFVKRIFS